MTTTYSQLQSPRLPANHPAHVEAILEREAKWRAERKKNRFWRAAISASLIVVFMTLTGLLLA